MRQHRRQARTGPGQVADPGSAFAVYGALRLQPAVSDHGHEPLCVLLVALNVLVAWRALGAGFGPFLISVGAGVVFLMVCGLMARPDRRGGRRATQPGGWPPPSVAPVAAVEARRERLERRLLQLASQTGTQNHDDVAAVVGTFLQLVDGELHGTRLRPDQAVRFLQLQRHDQCSPPLVRALERLLVSEPDLAKDGSDAL